MIRYGTTCYASLEDIYAITEFANAEVGSDGYNKTYNYTFANSYKSLILMEGEDDSVVSDCSNGWIVHDGDEVRCA